MELQYAQPPSHEDILRVIRRNLNTEPSCEKVSCIEMSFLLQMVDLERRNMVFSDLTKCTGVTEGKFALLMVLHDAGMPLPVGELAARLRVSEYAHGLNHAAAHAREPGKAHRQNALRHGCAVNAHRAHRCRPEISHGPAPRPLRAR